MVDEQDAQPELVVVIVDRLQAHGLPVQTGGLQLSHWTQAAKASMLVFLPWHGLSPFSDAAVRAAGGLVLRGWPDAWQPGELFSAFKALRAIQAHRRIVVPAVSAVKDLGVVIGAGRRQHQDMLSELFRRASLVGKLNVAMYYKGKASCLIGDPGGHVRLRGPAAGQRCDRRRVPAR